MKFTKFISATFALASFCVQAGNEIGNGGIGVVLNGSSWVWLLDFAENGIDIANYGDVELDPEILLRVNAHLKGELCHSSKVGWRADEICVKVAQKFSEIQASDPIMFNFLFYAFEKLDFKAVDAELVPIDDIGASPIEHERSQLRQLATRVGTTVRFDRRLIHKKWLYNADHLVGLVFHEIMYSTASVYDQAPTAREIRESIGYLFGNASLRAFPDLAARMPAHFPSATGMAGEKIGKWRVDERMDSLKLSFFREDLGIEVFVNSSVAASADFVVSSTDDIGSHARKIEIVCANYDHNRELRSVEFRIRGAFSLVYPAGLVDFYGKRRSRTLSTFTSSSNEFETSMPFDNFEAADCVRKLSALVESQSRRIFESYSPLEEIGLYPGKK